jgi:DNA-directed RNA polymerase beta subunit
MEIFDPNNVDQVPPYIERLPNGRPDYPLARNLRMPVECMGLELPGIPLGNYISSQRLNMYTTMATQALIVNGAEFPIVASGFEREYLEYTLNSTRFDQDSVILKIIPIFRTYQILDAIKYCPRYVVIYLGLEDNKIHAMYASTYTKGTNGFGWKNYFDKVLFREETTVSKGDTLTHSNAVQNSKYCPGLNAFTLYATMPGAVEDAVVVSDAFTKRAIATGYKDIVVDIHKDMVPLNLYGDKDNYKFMPDIGEKVMPGGFVCAFRKVDQQTYYADLTEQALCTLQPLHDAIYYQIDKDATVVDVKVYKNPNKKVLTPSYMFDQLTKYEAEDWRAHDDILAAYDKYCKVEGHAPAHDFVSLVTRVAREKTVISKKVLGVTRKSTAKFKTKDNLISYIRLEITLEYKIIPHRGSKLTGSAANKGVISDVVPEEHMPVNDNGIRAEVIINPQSVPNRMNPQQLYICFLSEMARRTLEDMKRCGKDYRKAFDIMVSLFYDVNPEYAKLIQQAFVSDKDIKGLVQDSFNVGRLVLVCPPFLDVFTTEWVLRMRDKYHIDQTPGEFNQLDRNGNVIRRVRTKRKMFI